MKNILIVDDHPSNRKLLRAMLEAEGFSTIEAPDGIEALKALGTEPVDAVISDILMPRMDGYRLCYEIRASKEFSWLPFIFCTNTYTLPSDEKIGLDLGADRFIRRPSNIQEILAAIHAAARQPSAARPGLLEAANALGLMKNYSEALVRKLEERSSDLGLLLQELAGTNELLSRQNEELRRARDQLAETNDSLEGRVRERTAQLEAANEDLEAFAHSVAHDLRSPLRAIEFHTRTLWEEAMSGADAKERLGKVLQNGREMNELIDDLLSLARVTRCPIRWERVDLSALAEAIATQLREQEPNRCVEIVVAPQLVADADEGLLRIALTNLLGNAWKFTAHHPQARIEVGATLSSSQVAYFIRDNGAGFDMQFVEKLFKPFQRLHSDAEFPGTGVGLAIVHRIVTRHLGRIWAVAELEKGATFFFTLSCQETSALPR